MINDRTTAGALAGIVGSIFQQLYAELAKIIGFTDKDFGDFAGAMIMYGKFQGVVSHIVQWLGHISVGMLLGIIFAQIFMYSSSKYWWFKGIAFGFILWFLLTSIGTLYKMPEWSVIRPLTALSIFVGSLIYSFVTSLTLKILDDRTNLI